MGIFKFAQDSIKRKRFVDDLNRRFKSSFVVNNDDYLIVFRTSITSDGLYLRGVIQNDYSLNEKLVKDIGEAILINNMVKRELFSLNFIGIQIVGKNMPVGLKWKLSDLDPALNNDHPYLNMIGSTGEFIGEIINKRKQEKELIEFEKRKYRWRLILEAEEGMLSYGFKWLPKEYKKFLLENDEELEKFIRKFDK